MPNISGNPFKIKDATLALGADTYEDMISLAELVPTTVSTTWKGIGGRNVTIVGKASWMLNLTFAQDWISPASLSNKLFAGEGEQTTATVTPIDGGPGFSVDVTLVAPNVGGAADSDASSTVALGCDSKPLIVTAPVA